MSEIVFFVSSTGVITLDLLKKSYEITLVGNSGIGSLTLMSRSLQSSTRPFCGVFFRSLFSCPPVPYCFSLLFLNVQCGMTASFSSLRLSSAHSLFAIGHQRRCMTRLALPVVVVRLGVTTHSKLIRMSSIGIWVCHTSHEGKTPGHTILSRLRWTGFGLRANIVEIPETSTVTTTFMPAWVGQDSASELTSWRSTCCSAPCCT